MIEKIYKFEMPYYIEWQLLNMNHYMMLNSQSRRAWKKTIYKFLDSVVPKMKLYTIRTDYVFYPKSYKRNDKNNVCTLIDKILMDYLVIKWYLIDDWNAFVKSTKFRLWPTDRKNPRVVVTIEANKLPKHLS
jgi:hypothetical protein